MAKESRSISWQAEEYIAHDHNIGWYICLFLIGGVLCVLSIILKWWTFLILIILSVIAILIYALRPPRTINYKLSPEGLTEGNTLHEYSKFRAFGIVKEDNHFSAVLIPKQRIGISVRIYFPESNGEAIVDALGARLPMEEVKPDFLDKIVKYLRI